MYSFNYLDNNLFRNVQNNMNNISLFNPVEGFEMGNMFVDLYSQYRNYKPVKLKGNSEKDRLYLELMSICFAVHDLNLYLDLHPDDVSMVALFNDYRIKENELKRKYENKYGPLTISSDSSVMDNTFMWVKDVWPWEGM